MRVVITGATGNVGTSLLPALLRTREVTSVVGVARRTPEHLPFPEVEWHAADVAEEALDPILRGADVLVHLAWAIQPSRDEAAMWRTNVLGTRSVMDAAARSGIGAVVYASSIGAYGAGRGGEPVDETWPVEGTPTSYYARHKAEVEWFLDGFELAHPQIRLVRLRPSLIFKREAASGIRSLFIGPFLPRRAFRPGSLPLFPDPGLSFQATHSDDVAEAFRLAAVSEVRGPFNIAAEPLLDVATVARLLEASPARIPLRPTRAVVNVAWRAHVIPVSVGWIDMAARVPVLDSARARAELGWAPRRTGEEALGELLAGLSEGADFPTPPLANLRRRVRPPVGSPVEPR